MSRAPRPAARRPWSRPAAEKRRPEGRGLIRRDEELESVLARVPGAGEGDRMARHHAVREVIERDRVEGRRREGLQDGLRPGTLEGQERKRIAPVDERAALGPSVAEPLQVLLDIPRVQHEAVALGPAAVDDDVVHRGAARHREGRVLRLPDRETGDVVARDPLEERQGPRSIHVGLPHVGHVEEPGGGPHGGVLGDEARVLDGHVPTAERDHLGAGGAMDLVEGRLPERAGLRFQGLLLRWEGHAITRPDRGSTFAVP